MSDMGESTSPEKALPRRAEGRNLTERTKPDV
jgi:hypothetical protein